MKKLLLLLISLFCLKAVAQSPYTVSGYVTDAQSGEKLIGASVYLPYQQQSTNTNQYGFYSITVPTDSLTIQFSFVGYTPQIHTLPMKGDMRLDIELLAGQLLKNVEIIGKREETYLERTQMSLHQIPIETIRKAPVLGGETDVLKTIQLLPGVKGGNEGSAGLYVRGGSPDQNLILLDGVPVYNVFHLFGFLSVFNSDAINNIQLYKGGIPARYGERLSSVLDIAMKEGNLKESRGVFAISPVASRVTYEAPIKKDVSSFIVSARRTWLDAIAAIASLANNRTLGYNFYDINAKFNQKIDANNRIYASFYTGRDGFIDTYKDGKGNYQYDFKWGNLTSVVRWNKIINPKMFSNFSLSYSTYDFLQEYNLDQTGTDYFYRTRSRIRDGSFQTDLNYQPSLFHSIRFGSKISLKGFSPEVVQLTDAAVDTTFQEQTFMQALNAEAYVEDDISLSDNIKVNAGMRGSLYQVQHETYTHLQPRLSIRYLWKDDLAMKVSYTYLAQYLHLLSNSSLGLPTDLWVSSTGKVAPQTSEQIAMGISRKLLDNTVELTLEGYYKNMNHLIAYANGASYLFQNSDTWENKVVSGNGESYGVELLIDKKVGDITGWLGYTLSYTNRWFDEIDNGRKFPFTYDRRHDLSVLINYHLPKQQTLSATFVFSTGNAVTFPTARYQGILPGNWNFKDFYANGFEQRILINERNNYRMPAYHRLDLSYQHQKDKSNGNRRTWILSLYNAYSRLNPYFLYEANGKLMKYSLFPIIPSVTYRLEF